ncbi:MAG: glycosyltransferase [Acidobacteriota bacterium]|nr:glycosyltransferase [Acidobacteriota bacterium]MDE3030541.1 glycosyltransferase [Acidobacteriota bacterium]MDE3043948.1 glycosyltransferase [Acidobacteriota bacterium]MDE3107660.1 glycosyltransferase [Acidobacteriota bacterium]MDE3223113.1 glycosyltransferase [Acidobacteriota bacterium]
MPALTFVIPAYNEGPRLAEGFTRLAPTLDQWGADDVEIIIVDDGSSDDTLRQAHLVYGHLAGLRVVRHDTNLGKGAALRLGLSLATGDAVITADADMAIHPHHAGELVTALARVDLAPGTRAINGHIRYEQRLRTYAGALFNRLARHYTGTTLRDTQCGFKGFRLASARLLALTSLVEGFAFDLEILYLADRVGLRVEPQLVTWDDVEGSSVHVGRDSRRMLRDLRQLRGTRYENPVVTLAADVDLDVVRRAVASARLHGPVLARGEHDALIVFSRQGALGALDVAQTLGATLRTAKIDELRGRAYEAL